MMTNINNVKEQVLDLKYWLENDLNQIVNILDNDERFEINKEKNCIDMCVTNVVTQISPEDLISVSKYRWTYSGKYIFMLGNENIQLHRFIANNFDSDCIDHINRNRLDNTRNNLRTATKQENSRNCEVSKNNLSGVTGVSFSKHKNKWKSYIFCDGRQIFLGYYTDINDAIRARLIGEKEYFKEFAPQKHLYSKYGITDNNSVTSVRIPIYDAVKHYKRICNLANTPQGSGHNQALTGIRIAFDLTFTNKAWVEAERYRFLEFVSSQSTMHRISKFNFREQYNEYVDTRIIDIMEELKDKYNQTQNKEDYLKLLYSNPCGFELTARLTTNYRCLKTIYSQRKNHRLPEWREFCKWIETLPYFNELIMCE